MFYFFFFSLMFYLLFDNVVILSEKLKVKYLFEHDSYCLIDSYILFLVLELKASVCGCELELIPV